MTLEDTEHLISLLKNNKITKALVITEDDKGFMSQSFSGTHPRDLFFFAGILSKEAMRRADKKDKEIKDAGSANG